MNVPSTLLAAILLVSCSGELNEKQLVFIDSAPINTPDPDLNIADSMNVEETVTPLFPVVMKDTVAYSIKNAQAEQLRLKLSRACSEENITIDSEGHAFKDFLVNKIIPHCHGTLWNYEGHTNAPREGEVACGYLVSTTLRHMNIQINRYHLAQQAASNGAKSLAINFDHISSYSEI